MIVNQASLKGLNVSYSAAYNKAFEGVKSNYEILRMTSMVFIHRCFQIWANPQHSTRISSALMR